MIQITGRIDCCKLFPKACVSSQFRLVLLEDPFPQTNLEIFLSDHLDDASKGAYKSNMFHIISLSHPLII